MLIDGLNWQQARLRAENDLWWFAKFVLNYDQLDENYHQELCDWFDEFDKSTNQYGLLMQPRGHYKTTLSTSRILQHWLRDEEKRFLLGSAKLKLAVDIMGIVKRHCEDNHKLRYLGKGIFWNDINQANKWLQDKICLNRKTVSNTYSLEIASPEAGLTSKHFHELVFDDIVDEDNSKTPYQRDNVKSWFKNCLNLRLGGAKILDIGTAWHYDDVHAMLRDPSGAYKNRVEIKINGAYGVAGATGGDPIFPRKINPRNKQLYGWDGPSLEECRVDMSDRVFFAQMLNDPTPRSEAIFKRENFVWFDAVRPPANKACHYYTAVDPNRGSKTEAGDFGVVMTAARDEDGHIWVVDIYRGHPTQQQLIEIIGQQVQRWSPKVVFFEVTAGQLRDAEALRTYQVKTGITFNQQDVNRSRASNKEDRVLSLESLVENRALHLKIGLCDELALELEHHGAWKHDDQVDCLADIWMKSVPPTAKRERVVMPNNPNTIAALHREAISRREAALRKPGIRRVWNVSA